MVLFYNVEQKLQGNNIGFIDDTSTKTSINTVLNTPSHSLGFETPNYSLLFGSEFSTWNGLLINNTLYKNYHENYILAIFNIKKRNFKYKAVLPLNILMNLELNDILKVGNQLHKIESYNTDITSGKTTLNLINSFDEVVGAFNVFPTDF